MFSISFSELLLVGILCIVVLKPDEIIKLVKWLRGFRQHIQAFRYQINTLLDDIEDQRKN